MKKSYIKGFLEDILLHLIAEKGEAYGYELSLLVEERSQGIIKLNEGALYPVLHRLEEQGTLVSSLKTDSKRPRKYYRLAGGKAEKEQVSQLQAEVQAYLRALESIFKKPDYGKA